MLFDDNDLILPFQQAVHADPDSLPFQKAADHDVHRLPFKMGMFKRLHSRFVMAHEDASVGKWKLQAGKTERIVEKFLRYNRVCNFQELDDCLDAEFDLFLEKKYFKKEPGEILKWLSEEASEGRINHVFHKTKVTEIMKVMGNIYPEPSREEWVRFFREAVIISYNIELNAEKILAALNVFDELGFTQEFIDLYESEATSQEQREEILQAVHEAHAKKWHFKPAKVFIGDTTEYGLKDSGGFTVRDDSQNLICVDKKIQASFLKAMDTIFHEGTHVYQFDLIDMISIILCLRMDYRSDKPFQDNEPDFLKVMKGLFPYQEGNLFSEMLYNEDLSDYALICMLGENFYSSFDANQGEQDYFFNPLEVLSYKVGGEISKYIQATEMDKRQEIRAQLESVVSQKHLILQEREHMFSSALRFDICQA